MHTGVRTLRLAALANSSQSPCKPKARNGACTEKKTVSELIYKKGRAGHLEITSFIKWQAVRFCIRIKLAGMVKQHRIFCSSVRNAVNNQFVCILLKHGLNQIETTDALWRIRIRTKINLYKFLFSHNFCFLCNSCLSVLFFPIDFWGMKDIPTISSISQRSANLHCLIWFIFKLFGSLFALYDLVEAGFKNGNLLYSWL